MYSCLNWADLIKPDIECANRPESKAGRGGAGLEQNLLAWRLPCCQTQGETHAGGMADAPRVVDSGAAFQPGEAFQFLHQSQVLLYFVPQQADKSLNLHRLKRMQRKQLTST